MKSKIENNEADSRERLEAVSLQKTGAGCSADENAD